MKRIKVIKPFNKRVKGDVFDCKDEKAKFWVDNGMAEYVNLGRGEVIPQDVVHGAAVPVPMTRVRVLKPFNKRDVDDVFEAKAYKAKFWVDSGMAEDLDEKERLEAEAKAEAEAEAEAKAKATKAAPKDKVVRGSEDK